MDVSFISWTLLNTNSTSYFTVCLFSVVDKCMLVTRNWKMKKIMGNEFSVWIGYIIFLFVYFFATIYLYFSKLMALFIMYRINKNWSLKWRRNNYIIIFSVRVQNFLMTTVEIELMKSNSTVFSIRSEKEEEYENKKQLIYVGIVEHSHTYAHTHICVCTDM